MFLKLVDMQNDRSLCINSAAVTCFYPEGKEGTVVCFEVLDENSERRGFVIKVKEEFRDILEALLACGEALQVVRGHGLPKDGRDKDG